MRSELPDEWINGLLGEHVDLLVGFAFKSAEFTDDPSDVRLLRGDNVGQGRLRWDGARRWPVESRSEYARYEVRPRDIVLAMDRPWIDAGLKYAIVREEDVPCLLVQRVARLRGSDTLSQRYLRYIIGGPEFTSYVLAVQTGTAVPHISGRQIEGFRFYLPPRREQDRIADVLGALDDKIDSNRRLAWLLEQTTAELFRGRFVDFVGVEDLEDSVIGRIPSGWRAGTLADLGRFVNGKAFTKEANDQGRPILRIKELNDGMGPRTPRTDVDAADDHLARHHDILFAWSGSLAAYRWSGPDALINQHIFKVIPTGYPAWFVYHWICQHMADFRRIARDKATTMGHIQRRHLSEATVPLPDADTLAAVNEVLGPLDERQGVLAAEGAALLELRDALLPRLISGQLRVPDAVEPDDVIRPVAEELAATTP